MLKDRFDTIYFNGCSFTEGGGLEETKDWVKQAYETKYNVTFKNEKDVCYPTIVQNNFKDIKVINDAKSGSGSERIVRRIYEYIHKHGVEKSQKTLFIVEIQSAINRLDIFSNKHNEYLVANVSYNDKGEIQDTQTVIDWIYGPPLDEDYRNKTRSIIREFSEYFINPIQYEKNVCYSYIGLLSFLQKNNISFLVSGNLYYFKTFYKFDYYFPNFFENHLLKVEYNGKEFDDIINFCGVNKKTIMDEIGPEISNDGHPGYFGHLLWGMGIVEFLNKKYI